MPWPRREPSLFCFLAPIPCPLLSLLPHQRPSHPPVNSERHQSGDLPVLCFALPLVPARGLGHHRYSVMSGSVTEQISGPEIRQGSCLYLNNSPCGRKSLNRGTRSACVCRGCRCDAPGRRRARLRPPDCQTGSGRPDCSLLRHFRRAPPEAAAAGVPVSSETDLEPVEDCN